MNRINFVIDAYVSKNRERKICTVFDISNRMKIFIILKFVGFSKIKIWGISVRLVRSRVVLRHDLQSCVIGIATGGLLVSTNNGITQRK